jgi:3-hydroxyisobutyrate dehydrogenase-like beta-hydroxyacid dehydrogenase
LQFDGEHGVINAVSPGKIIVDCATLSPERMIYLANQVSTKGGHYLEAPVSGSKVSYFSPLCIYRSLFSFSLSLSLF